MGTNERKRNGAYESGSRNDLISKHHLASARLHGAAEMSREGSVHPDTYIASRLIGDFAVLSSSYEDLLVAVTRDLDQADVPEFTERATLLKKMLGRLVDNPFLQAKDDVLLDAVDEYTDTVDDDGVELLIDGLAEVKSVDELRIRQAV